MPVPRHAFVGVTLLVSIGCGGDGGTKPPGDQIPPSSVRNLAVTSVLETEVILRWASPGDDDVSGTASRYDVRYSSTPLTHDNFLSALAAPSAPSPRFSGTMQTLAIDGLERGRWFFALRSADEVPNWSALSNVISVAVGDSIAPSAVTDLVAASIDEETIELTWTAPGDDGTVGASSQYEVRYSTLPLSDASWAAATILGDVPVPSAAGSGEVCRVSSLSRDETFYFALKSRDDGTNWSGLSNIASATTRLDTVAPAAVTDLLVDSFTGRTATLIWSCPGDDGMDGIAHSYDLRYSDVEITAENFESAVVVDDVIAPARPGDATSFTVSGLEPLTQYFFALRTADEVPNWSSLSNVTSLETSSSWQLTFSPDDFLALDPDWSPDGTMIAFYGTPDDQWDIYLVATAGGEPIRLTETLALDHGPAWSPDGTQIAFCAGLGPGELHVMAAAPGASSTPIVSDPKGVDAACWSPDGSVIAYQTHPLASLYLEVDVYSVPAAGGNPRVLVAHGQDWGNFDPSWSPDGTRLVVSSTRDESWDLWTVPLDGGAWTQLTHGTWNVFYGRPDWSPDGTTIAYAAHRDGRGQIFRIPATGGESEQLTHEFASSSYPTWSPDGTRIAFASDRSGKWEIWIQIVE